jgi:hypothetical protein
MNVIKTRRGIENIWLIEKPDRKNPVRLVFYHWLLFPKFFKQYIFNLFTESWHFFGSCQPDNFPFDRKIGMHSKIPEINHIHPRGARVKADEFIGQVRCGFADDDQFLQYRAAAHIIIAELVKCDPHAKYFNGLTCLDDISQILFFRLHKFPRYPKVHARG